MDSLRISGDLPELHLDLQINHEAGKALVVLVADGRTWSCFRIIAKRHHSSTANHCEAQLEHSGNPFPIVWPSF